MFSRKSSPSADRQLLDAYRAAVAELVVCLREHELTASHLGRQDYVAHREAIAAIEQVKRELWNRLDCFDQVEKGHWRRYYKSLDAEYRQRDAVNRETRAAVVRGDLP